MDQELKSYLDELFREFSRQIDESRQESNQKIDALRGEVGSLRGEVEALRQESNQKIDGLRDGLDGLRVELREEIRLTQVSLEGVRSDLQLLAEGVVDTRDLFALHQAMTQESLREIREMVYPVFRSLSRRMEVLEETNKHQAQDCMEVIRAKFGTRQRQL